MSLPFLHPGLQARLVRRSLRRSRQKLRYGWSSLENTPIFFANSFPKSGTHLLTQVLEGFTHLGPAVNSGLSAISTFEGGSGRQRTSQEILADLNRLKPGDIAYGHLHAIPQAVGFLCRGGVAPYFILRDPRDVVLSHVHYVTEMAPNHIHHDYYRNRLDNVDERLKVSILGRPDMKDSFPNIRERFEPYLNWLERPETLTLHYEDFIHNREPTIERVLEHARSRGFSLRVDREAAIRVLIESIDPRQSPTFRSGRTGAWREQFTQDHKTLFKDTAGDLLVRLGYEDDNQW